MQTKSQFGFSLETVKTEFPDLAALEQDLKKRFGTQGLLSSSEFALTQI